MRARNLVWNGSAGWTASGACDAQLVLFFGQSDFFRDPCFVNSLRELYPSAHLVGCSTGGQIIDHDVSDEAGSGVAIQFEKTRIAVTNAAISDKDSSFKTGQKIAETLAAPDLRGIFVLSDGLNVNGSQLVSGLRSIANGNVVITGGLAGDGAAFQHTVVHANGQSSENQIAAVGLYGDDIVIGNGSAGGWDVFGPKRLITKSKDNVLYAFDGQPALDLYKLYLGDEAAGLPGTGLLYPLLVSDPSRPESAVVRTILAIDDEAGSMTFAGDVPEGWTAQLMRGRFDRLSAAAATAATAAMPKTAPGDSDTAAIMISCIGRRILLGEGIVEELMAAKRAFGEGVVSTGFYSYGEISPHAASGFCELHNQTMTVTTFSEAC